MSVTLDTDSWFHLAAGLAFLVDGAIIGSIALDVYRASRYCRLALFGAASFFLVNAMITAADMPHEVSAVTLLIVLTGKLLLIGRAIRRDGTP